MTLFYNQIQPQITNIKPYIPGKPIADLKRELNLVRVSKLASNENPLGASERVKKALQDLLIDIARYPDGSSFELKKSLSDNLGLKFNQISIGNGSNELLGLVARIFASDGDEIIFSQYAFAVYPISAQVVGATGVSVPAKNWGHDLKAMLKAISDRTKIIYIANPNNPTGTLVSIQDWDYFIKQVPQQVIVVLDEAYFEYVAENQTINGLDYLKRFPNLLVSRTFSKVYGLASLRVGYIMGCEEIISYIEKVREPFNVNQFAQVGALAALEDNDFVTKSIKINNIGMEKLTDFFTKKNLPFIPSAGNFVSIDLGNNAININQQLLELGVIVRPLANYGMNGFLRISIGTSKENEHFIEAMSKVLCQ
jgi:histidinol-phosphate aminotransferase